MQDKKMLEQELAELRDEISHFRQEKDRVRKIVGQIGGVPALNSRMSNIIFTCLVIFPLIISLMKGGTLRLLTIEFAIAIMSAKLIYLMHNQARVSHFELWILTSLEWRINEIQKSINKIISKIQIKQQEP